MVLHFLCILFFVSSTLAYQNALLSRRLALSPIKKTPCLPARLSNSCSRSSHQIFSSTTSISTESSSGDGLNVSEREALKQKVKVGGLFALWYALNVGYNIYNKRVLNAVPQLTYTVAFLQLFLGLAYVLPVWGLGIREKPELSKKDLINLMPVAILHCLTHLGAIVSLGAGAVSFTHIVKAAEPAISAGLSALVLKQYLALPVYLSLIPVMTGVAIASLKELSFSWLAFGGAMVSNFASASRGIVGKLQMALFLESGNILSTLTMIKEAGLANQLMFETALSAIFYYLYNEVAFLTLSNVAPVTHALGNTIKRVVIIIASVVYLGSKLTTQGIFGSSLAIGGVLLYSVLKSRYN